MMFILIKIFLRQIIVDYFTDLYRLKTFHQISNANIVKITSIQLIGYGDDIR